MRLQNFQKTNLLLVAQHFHHLQEHHFGFILWIIAEIIVIDQRHITALIQWYIWITVIIIFATKSARSQWFIRRYRWRVQCRLWLFNRRQQLHFDVLRAFVGLLNSNTPNHLPLNCQFFDWFNYHIHACVEYKPKRTLYVRWTLNTIINKNTKQLILICCLVFGWWCYCCCFYCVESRFDVRLNNNFRSCWWELVCKYYEHNNCAPGFPTGDSDEFTIWLNE